MHHAGRRTAARAARTTAALLVRAAAPVAFALALTATPVSAAPKAPAPVDATTLYREAVAATHGWSVHYDSLSTVSKTMIQESGDAGPASGTQTVALGKNKVSFTDNATIIVIGGITYLKGNAAALGDLAGMSPDQAAAAAGQWLDFATDDATLASVSTGVRSSDVAKELALTGPYRLGHGKTLSGLRVDAVEGTQTIGGKHYDVVMYVRSAGTHVPVEEDALDSSGKPNGVLHVVYSKWGEVVRPMAPQAAGSLGPVSSI